MSYHCLTLPFLSFFLHLSPISSLYMFYHCVTLSLLSFFLHLSPILSLCMSYHCLTLLLLSFFLHLSPFFLCLFVPSITLFQLVSNFKFLLFHISSFYIVYLCACHYMETWSSRLIEEEFVFTLRSSLLS